MPLFTKLDGPGWVKHPDDRTQRIFFPPGPMQIVPDTDPPEVEYGPARFETDDEFWVEALRRFPTLYREEEPVRARKPRQKPAVEEEPSDEAEVEGAEESAGVVEPE